jgi:hypothetical protein
VIHLLGPSTLSGTFNQFDLHISTRVDQDHHTPRYSVCSYRGTQIPMERLRRSQYTDMFDSLFVHSLLQHATHEGHGPLLSRSRRSQQDVQSSWHEFLDDLCFMCDHCRGGQSVVALLAEDSQCETVFWLATDSTNSTQAAEHLRHVLCGLNVIGRSDHILQAHLVDRIVKRTIELSRDRVAHYESKLRTLVMEIQSTSQWDGWSDSSLNLCNMTNRITCRWRSLC